MLATASVFCVRRMKELELEDKQYEVDQELAELCQVSRK